MTRYLALSAVLVVFWLLLSGHYTPLFLFFAAVSIGLVLFINFRMDRIDNGLRMVRALPALIGYCLWLAKETVLANIDMVKRVWQPKMPISPRVAKIKATQTTRIGKVIYANSITLTPGTVTLDIDEEKNEFEVHAIVHSQIDDLQKGEMDSRVKKLEH